MHTHYLAEIGPIANNAFWLSHSIFTGSYNFTLTVSRANASISTAFVLVQRLNNTPPSSPHVYLDTTRLAEAVIGPDSRLAVAGYITTNGSVTVDATWRLEQGWLRQFSGPLSPTTALTVCTSCLYPSLFSQRVHLNLSQYVYMDTGRAVLPGAYPHPPVPHQRRPPLCAPCPSS